jgi:cellulose synthase/poly-beta-1,6-N-acetylglucosamine synthase-like glycosyltransferase
MISIQADISLISLQDEKMILYYVIMSILLLLFLISVYNYYTAPVFTAKYNDKSYRPLISILIPARNEEKNIRNLLESLLAQDYDNIEVIVGNDNSSDSTPAVVDEFAENFTFISGINIPPLPEGWKGKNHAAHILSSQARGRLLLFIDADVMIEAGTISSAAAYMNETEADIMSVFPRQLIYSPAERLIVPLLNFFLLSLLPLREVYRSSRISLTAGIGQFMIFKQSAYDLTGGHISVRNKTAEDMELVRLAKKKKLKVLAMLDGGLISCRMYDSLKQAYMGFVKNFYSGTSLSAPVFIVMLFIYCSALILPFLLIFLNIYYIIPLVMILIMRLIISIKSGQEVINILLHPFQIITMFIIGISSVILKGNIQWKGRRV